MVNVTDILDRTSALEKKCVPRHVHVLRRQTAEPAAFDDCAKQCRCLHCT